MHITKRYDLARFVFYFALANFFAFMSICAFLGGSAGNGMVRSGHFYVGDHGKVTEVSERVYRLCQIHEYTVFIMLPFGILAMAYANSIKTKSENYPFRTEDV